jgi:hypothetical protein
MPIHSFEDAITKARTLRSLHASALAMQKAGIAKGLERRYYQVCADLVKELAEAQKPSEQVHTEKKENTNGH